MKGVDFLLPTFLLQKLRLLITLKMSPEGLMSIGPLGISSPIRED
jgi:hypothetical protein